MTTTAKPATKPTSPKHTNQTDLQTGDISTARQNFLIAFGNMSWQLAIVVLVPILAGVKLDQHFKTGSTLTIVGLVLAMIGMGLVMWRTLQVANRIPVPKLTAKQKRDIQKQYAKDDADE